MKYLMDSYNLVMTAARAVEIYGLTVDMPELPKKFALKHRHG